MFWRLSRRSPKSHTSAACSRVNFGVLFASEGSSREGYIEIFAAQLATPSWVELPVAKNTQKFFYNFVFECFGGQTRRLVGDSLQSRKSRVWQKLGQFFKTFSVFPSNFCDYSLSSPFLSQLKLTQTLLKLHLCIISSQIFKKRYGFSLSHFIFHVLSLFFLFL